MKICIFLLVSIATLAKTGQSAEVLVVDPAPAYSHYIIPFKIAKELAKRGHQVTCINSYPQKTKIENYTDIPVVENIAVMEHIRKSLFNRSSLGAIEIQITDIFDMMAEVVNTTIQHKNVQELLKSDKKFDAVIIENFFNEALVGLGHRFNAPVILFSTVAATDMNNYIFANPSPPSYIPTFNGNLPKYMNFWQRIESVLKKIYFNGLIHLYHLPQQNKIFKSYISDVELDDVLYNTSLMLTNSHVSISDAIPLVPGIVEVGGLHVTPKPLPEDLKKFFDEATDGVVLFSMGSNLKSTGLKRETREGILKAFSKIKQKVLWKFEDDLPNLPENVKIMSWLPQQDVLAHPKVRAFITHGGRLGTIEAVYFGVPLIGIPVLGDQPANVAAAVNDGYAVRIDVNDLSEETLTQALNEILTNPKYRENIQRRSQLIHDQPLKPMDSAIFWIEHVIRHKGAPHLRSAGLDLEWYQRELIDVFAFLFLIFGTLLTVIYLVIKKLFNCLFRHRATTKTKKNQ